MSTDYRYAIKKMMMLVRSGTYTSKSDTYKNTLSDDTDKYMYICVEQTIRLYGGGCNLVEFRNVVIPSDGYSEGYIINVEEQFYPFSLYVSVGRTRLRHQGK